MYIRKFRDGWRVEVQRHGMRASFAAGTKREVQEWGVRKELELNALKSSKGLAFSKAAEKYVQTVSRDKAAGAADWEARRFAEMAVFF